MAARTGARVYSYIRFSTPEQAMGESERRQLDAAKAFAKRNGLPFDDSVLLADRGLSGFTGSNRKRGALGKFLAMVEAGEVPAGSILVVENIDRLSREGVVDALQKIIFGLIGHGIVIQTLSPERTYTKDSLNRGQAWELLGHIDRAHEESKRKSTFGRDNWSKKRQAAENGILLTSRCPIWLTAVWGRDKHGRNRPEKFEVLPNAAETIRQIFAWKLEGLGNGTIVRRLNAGPFWKQPTTWKRNTTAPGWRESYIKKLLTNPAVIGIYQPHQRITGKRLPHGEPIEGYYPAIVKPDSFHAVQAVLKKNIANKGRVGRQENILRHLVKCAYCGTSMAYLNKGTPPKGQKYLICDTARRGLGCHRQMIRYDEAEQTLLENCPRLQPELILPNPGVAAKQQKALARQLEAKRSELAEVEKKIANLVDQIASTESKSIRNRYETLVAELESKEGQFRSELKNGEAELSKLQEGHQSFTDWKEGLERLLAEKKKDNAEFRLRLHLHLRSIIDRVDVFSLGFFVPAKRPIRTPNPTKNADAYAGAKEHALSQPDEEDLAEFVEAMFEAGIPSYRPSERMSRFFDYVRERRVSKDGRFIRVHFKTGAVVDLVPPGSIASGSKLAAARKGRGNWQTVNPSVVALWEEFLTHEAQQKKARKPVSARKG